MTKSNIEILCIKIKLSKLKRDRINLRKNTINLYPKAFNKADSVESLNPIEFDKLDKDILKYYRLLSIKKLQKVSILY